MRKLIQVRWAALATLAWAVLLAGATLTPAGAARPAWLLVGPAPAVADMVANLAAFVPLGALAAVATGRVPLAALGGLAFSACIEVVQGVGVPGRYATLTDLVANGAGAALGALLAARRDLLLRPERAAARRLALAWAAAAGLLLAGTQWLNGPGRPSARYEGQFSELWNRERLPEYQVQVAHLNGRPFAWGLLPQPEGISRRLAERNLTLQVALYPGPPEPGEHRLAAISSPDEGSRRVVRLATVGRRVQFSVRTRGEQLGLHAPYVQLRDALRPQGGAPGGNLVIGGSWDGDLLSAWVDDGITPRTAVRALGPLDGWQYVLPPVVSARLDAPAWRLLEALALALPLLWWGWRAGRPEGD
jgi:hypothetical protein